MDPFIWNYVEKTARLGPTPAVSVVTLVDRDKQIN